MSMKALAIMGSPKGKCAGYKIVRRIEDRMKAMGDVEFEYLFLKDTNLQPCQGCFTCSTKGSFLKVEGKKLDDHMGFLARSIKA